MKGVRNCTECELAYIGNRRRNCNIEMCETMTGEHTQTDIEFFKSFHNEIIK